jgi:hypothetical protein
MFYKEKHRSSVVSIKQVGLEVNADETKYMVMSLDQNADKFTIWRLIIVPVKGWMSSNVWEQPNSIQEEIKRR